MSKGKVYVISNPSMPNMVKIGMTTRTVQKRIAELNRASGIPTPFKVEYVFEVSDCHAVEKAAHRALSRSRVASNREFFAVTPDDAKNVIESISNRPPSDLSGHAAGDFISGLGCVAPLLVALLVLAIVVILILIIFGAILLSQV